MEGSFTGMNPRNRLLLAEIRQAEVHNRAIESRQMWAEYQRSRTEAKRQQIGYNSFNDETISTDQHHNKKENYQSLNSLNDHYNSQLISSCDEIHRTYRRNDSMTEKNKNNERRSHKRHESSRKRKSCTSHQNIQEENKYVPDEDSNQFYKENYCKRSESFHQPCKRTNLNQDETNDRKRHLHKYTNDEIINNESDSNSQDDKQDKIHLRHRATSRSTARIKVKKESKDTTKTIDRWEKVKRKERKRKAKLLKKKFAEQGDDQWRPDLYYTEVKQKPCPFFRIVDVLNANQFVKGDSQPFTKSDPTKATSAK